MFHIIFRINMQNIYIRDHQLRNIRDQELNQLVPQVMFPRVNPTEFMTDLQFKRQWAVLY